MSQCLRSFLSWRFLYFRPIMLLKLSVALINFLSIPASDRLNLGSFSILKNSCIKPAEGIASDFFPQCKTKSSCLSITNKAKTFFIIISSRLQSDLAQIFFIRSPSFSLLSLLPLSCHMLSCQCSFFSSSGRSSISFSFQVKENKSDWNSQKKEEGKNCED